MRKFLLEEKILVAHNQCRWDIPNLERILGIEIKNRVVDTLGLSWTMFPKRTKHGLDEWGEDVGIKKPRVDDWENLPIEEYIKRCEEDVKINFKVWERIFSMLHHLYDGNLEEIWRYCDYIGSKLYQARLQEESRWKLDIPFTERALIKLLEEQREKTSHLQKAMPKVPIIKKRIKPKRWQNKNGELTKLAEDWVNQLKELNLPLDTLEFEFISDYEEPNPNSTDQIKSWLTSLGWKPETFKQVKDKETGKIREIPQINKEKQKGGGVCESIKKLYEKEPNLEYLDGLSILNHRIGILQGFLRDQKGGYLQAKISGFTNTLRVKHTEIVNLPKINIAYGEYLRGALICEEDQELCGADMSGLENRLKEHYIYPLDPDYVAEMSKPDFDAHLDIAKLAGRMSDKDIEDYKNGDKSKKLIRDIMKNVNYALTGACKIV